MLEIFVFAALLLIHFFLDEKNTPAILSFKRHPFVWSGITGMLASYLLHQACFLFHDKIQVLGNIYGYISKPTDTYYLEFLPVVTSFSILGWFLRCLWSNCCEGSSAGVVQDANYAGYVKVVPSQPGEIGRSIKGLLITVLAMVCFVCGLDLMRSDAMTNKWVKVTGSVSGLEQSSRWDAKNGRHYLLEMRTVYTYGKKSFVNTHYFSDGEIAPAMKRYAIAEPVSILCNPRDLEQSVVEQERKIPQRSRQESQFVTLALLLMLVLWIIPCRFLDFGLNNKLAGEYRL
jgi:hypothetical protein